MVNSHNNINKGQKGYLTTAQALLEKFLENKLKRSFS